MLAHSYGRTTMKTINGDEAEKLILDEYERQVQTCEADIRAGAITLATCASYRAQGLRKALLIIKGMDDISND